MNIAPSATLDVHKEQHVYKNVADNEYNVNIAMIQQGIITYPKHPGVWISKPEP